MMKDSILDDLASRIPEGEVEIHEPNDDVLEAGLSVEKGFTEEDADPDELAMGVKIEMEHTTNPDVSKKIALDHLAEIPDYYTRLVKMEREAGRDMDEMLK